MMNRQGVTLVELIVVVAIVGILAVVLGFDFSGWMGRYNVESQMKQIEADMVNARIRAMTTTRYQFFTCPVSGTPPVCTSYSVYDDDKPSPNGDAKLIVGTDKLLSGYPKALKYSLAWVSGTLSFDRKGVMNSVDAPDTSPFVLKVETSPSIPQNNPAITADINCIVVTYTRVSLGKMNGSTCVAQ
jgi:prepilin-type N-terminal cleavage/methylation domain-containing protein